MLHICTAHEVAEIAVQIAEGLQEVRETQGDPRSYLQSPTQRCRRAPTYIMVPVGRKGRGAWENAPMTALQAGVTINDGRQCLHGRPFEQGSKGYGHLEGVEYPSYDLAGG